jgi:hypothetical protein
MQAIRNAPSLLRSDMPLIGFAGASFILASFMIEGGGSRNYIQTKTLMYRAPQAWHTLMGHLSCHLAQYLNSQIAAGVQAVQLFDSWVGNLSPVDYRTFVLPHTQALIAALQPGVPVITVAGTNGKGSVCALLESILAADGYRVGLYTSPHLARFNERIRVGGAEVLEEVHGDDQERDDYRARGSLSTSRHSTLGWGQNIDQDPKPVLRGVGPVFHRSCRRFIPNSSYR